MYKRNNTLTMGDTIFATLSVDGRTVASLNSNRFASINDVIRLIYRAAGKFAGMAKLLIRNQSQGWTTTLPLASNII